MLILASQSPRRKQLLALCGWNFSILPADVDEGVYAGESPSEYVERLAQAKACAVYEKVRGRADVEDLIIGADTAVVDYQPSLHGKQGNDLLVNPVGFRILGKPSSPDEAHSMLRDLRGKTHQVFSAVVIKKVKDGDSVKDVCVTDVPMRNFIDEEISTYVASGDALDKAGAYAIQHSGFNPVHNLQGCYANVMGLPLCHLTRLLMEVGLEPDQEVPSSCQVFTQYICSVFEEILPPG